MKSYVTILNIQSTALELFDAGPENAELIMKIAKSPFHLQGMYQYYRAIGRIRIRLKLLSFSNSILKLPLKILGSLQLIPE